LTTSFFGQVSVDKEMFRRQKLSFVDDSLKWSLKIGNQIIVPTQANYKEELICKSLHCFKGNFDVTNKLSYFNPFFEISKKRVLKNNNKFSFNFTLGYQFIKLENFKSGEYFNPSQAPVSNFRGTINNVKKEYSGYFAFEPTYKLFNDNRLSFFCKINLRFDYIHQVNYSEKTIGVNNVYYVDASSKAEARYGGIYIISFGSIEAKYHLTKKIVLAGQLNVPLFYLNDLFKDPTRDPYNVFYNSPSYILDYRSSINHINYLTINLSVSYHFKINKHAK
jgi:hypothetical protein